MLINVTNNWNDILTTTKYTIIKAEINDIYITTGDDVEGIRLEQGKTFLIGAGFNVKARSSLSGSKLSYLESEFPVSVTGGTGGGGGGSSDTTETTQLLVKAAVQAINTKTDSVLTNIGDISNTPATTDSDSFSIIALIKRGLQNWTTLHTKIPTSVSGRIPVDNSGVTQPVSATALPLPAGASTSALQTTINTSLTNINNKLPALGQKTLANSVSVGLASDQSFPLATGASTAALQTTGNTSLGSIDTKIPTLVSGRIPVDSSGVTQPVSATALPLPTGASTAALQTTGNTSLSSIDAKIPALGQKTLANSIPVGLASDQVFSLPTGASTSALQTTGNTSLSSIDAKIPALGQKTLANSISVGLASDQSFPLAAGASTSALQTTGNTSLGSIDTKLVNIGEIADTTATSDTGSFSVIAFIKRGLQNWTTLQAKLPALVSGRIPVDNSGVTQPVSATALPLPTGASTSALQTTGNTSLNSIDTKIPALGQKTLANSIPVGLASDQVFALPTGASTSALQTTGNTSLNNIDTKIPTLVSGRIPVDSSGVTQPVSATALPLPTGASTAALQTTGNTSLTAIDTKLGNVGAIADAAATTEAGAFSLIALTKRGLQNWTTLLARTPATGTVASPSSETNSVQDRNGEGSVTYITDTTAVTGLSARHVVCLTDTTFSAFVRTNATGSIVGVYLPAGTLLVGPVTGITLSFGAVAAYN